jgi:hypothetical protein
VTGSGARVARDSRAVAREWRRLLRISAPMRKSGAVWRGVAESEVAKYVEVLQEVLLGSVSALFFCFLL